MDLLKGKRIIVTAGASGLGKAFVLTAAREGASVVSVSRALPTSERVTAMLEEAGKTGQGPVTHMQLDVTQYDEVDRVMAKAVDWLGGLDVLVCSAANELQKPAADLTPDDFNSLLAVHLLGTTTANIAAYRVMKAAGGGSIINVASSAGLIGVPGQAAYSAAKGAVLAWTRTAAKEWGPDGVRVNVLNPWFESEMMSQWFASLPPEKKAEMEAYFRANCPLGGWPADVQTSADCLVFLASDLSRFVTGQILCVDGGGTMVR